MEPVKMEVMLPVGIDSASNVSERGRTSPVEGATRATTAVKFDAVVLPLVTFLIVIGVWALISHTVAVTLPDPFRTFTQSWDLIRSPFLRWVWRSITPSLLLRVRRVFMISTGTGRGRLSAQRILETPRVYLTM